MMNEDLAFRGNYGDVRVRPFKEGEGLLWKQLRLKALQQTPDAFSTTYDSQKNRADSEWYEFVDETAKSPTSENLLAEIRGQPAGILRCRWSESSNETGYIRSMWVDERWRRRKVGSALLGHALAL